MDPGKDVFHDIRPAKSLLYEACGALALCVLGLYAAKSSMSQPRSANSFPALGLVELAELLSVYQCKQAIFVLTWPQYGGAGSKKRAWRGCHNASARRGFMRIKPRGSCDQSLGRRVGAPGVFACHFCGRIEAKRMEAANQRKCHNCGQTGHLRRDCPEASTQEGGFGGYSGAACFGCGKVGHLKRDCPTAAGGRACHNCGQTGHIRRDCPEDVQPPKCHNCGESGHLRRDCPQELRESRKCHHCGQSGHLRRDCPDDSGPSEDKCYQCGETGHWARNCPGAKE
ncbi:hypothetical protein V7S43_013222 [Phytophthora oleae]|uniref:CCHC-type domain-containing protein n=1 Tax=Phytophthora oleae TaxID=2107226 RepID=A0ABD3F8Z2_9STRA